MVLELLISFVFTGQAKLIRHLMPKHPVEQLGLLPESLNVSTQAL